MNRGGGKFFRPGTGTAPAYNSSSDEDSDDDIEDQDMPAPPPKKPSVSNNNNSNSNNANLSSSGEDSDGSEDNDNDHDRSDSEDGEPSRFKSSSNKRSRPDDPKSKSSSSSNKKSKPSSSFFDEEAEASDDDEAEEEEYGTHHDPHDKVKKHYTDEDIRRENMDREAQEMIDRQNRRRQHINKFTAEESAEEIARQIEMRHRMASRRVDRAVLDDASVMDGVGGQNLSAVTQQSLLPSVSDPSLWMFNCQTGKEQEMVFQIMNKCIAFARQGKPLGITSAVAAQSKGRIYIESYSEPAVREAVQGINGLMAYSMRLVPISDMTTVMNVTAKKKPGKYG